MNAKIERINKEIEKAKEKVAEFQARVRELEKQKTELENIDIIEAVRGMDIPLNDLASILKAFRTQGGAPSSSGQLGPKRTAIEKGDNEA